MISLLFVVIFFLTYILYVNRYNYLASIFMLAFSLLVYFYDVLKKKNLVCLRGIFTLGFLLSFSISFLKLSNLTYDYDIRFFVVIFVCVFSFYLSYDLNYYFKVKNSDLNISVIYKCSSSSIFKILIFTMFISFISFLIEVSVLKFIPLFVEDTPHAYSSFHIFMLHYITTLYVFVPSLSIIYFYISKITNKINISIILKTIIGILYAIVMSILLVSRGQLLMSLILMFFTFCLLNFSPENINIFNIKQFFIKYYKLLLSFFLIIVVLYSFITIKRSHSTEYLNDIFDMKNKNLPLFITQPYIYLTEGFENLNYLIINLKEFSFGKRVFQPLFTFTFMNKLFPFDLQTEFYTIKTELVNMTFLYDIYYDFSYIGVVIFSLFLGYISYKLEYLFLGLKVSNNPIIVLFYVLFAYCLLMSFFQPLFSLTSILVYFIYIYFLYVIINNSN